MDFLQILSFLLIYICLPVAGIFALVYLVLLLRQTISTMKRFDALATNIEEKIALLEGPIEAVGRIHEHYSKMSGTLSAALASLAVIKKHRKKKREEK